MSVEALCEAACEAVRSDAARARELADEASRLAGESGLARDLGLAARCDAILLWTANRYPDALAQFERALTSFQQAGDEVEGARTRSNALQTLIYLSRYDQALEWAAAAREVFVRRDEPLRLARLDGNVANLLYRQDRFEEAIRLYEDVESRFARFGQPRDVAAVMRNKAVCQLSLSRFDEALVTHESARNFSQQHGMAQLVAESDYNIAYLHFLRGDYLVARALYERARLAAADAKDAYHAALCDLDEAEMLLELNLNVDAGLMADRAVRAFRRLRVGYEAAKAQVFLGLCSGQQGDSRRALRLLQEARKRFVVEQNAIWPPLIDLYAALLLHRAGIASRARQRCRLALGFFSPTVLPGKAIQCRLLLGRIDLEGGQLRSAESHAAAAERLLPYAQSPALAGHVSHLLGQIREAQGREPAALEAYSRAEEQFEGVRDRLLMEDLRLSYFKDKAEVYESHFRILVQNGRIGEAWVTAERAKSRRLSWAVAPRRHPAGETRTRLDQLYRQLEAAEVAGTASAGLRERIREAEGSLRRELISEPGTRSSETMEWVLAKIPQGTQLVEYFRSGPRFYAFVLGGGRATVRRLGAVDRVLELLRFLRLHLTPFAGGTAAAGSAVMGSVEQIRSHLGALYQELLEPLRADLTASHCTIVPHGILHGLPFHALFDGERYLGESFTLAATPSAGAYCELLDRKAGTATGAAVFGVPDETAPQIADECRKVAGRLGGRLFLGPEASRSAFREAAPECRILHLATHSRFRQDNPWFSSMRLGDGYLSLYDLYEVPLRADLVVLSGCSTGLSVVMGGDEVVGLARGLFQAGASAAVLSLWDVNDASTVDWMDSFYAALLGRQDLQRQSPARAMQAAQSAMRERYPHPYYWAAFGVMGAAVDFSPAA